MVVINADQRSRRLLDWLSSPTEVAGRRFCPFADLRRPLTTWVGPTEGFTACATAGSLPSFEAGRETGGLMGAKWLVIAGSVPGVKTQTPSAEVQCFAHGSSPGGGGRQRGQPPGVERRRSSVAPSRSSFLVPAPVAARFEGSTVLAPGS
jgi:hypothetical protein